MGKPPPLPPPLPTPPPFPRKPLPSPPRAPTSPSCVSSAVGWATPTSRPQAARGFHSSCVSAVVFRFWMFKVVFSFKLALCSTVVLPS